MRTTSSSASGGPLGTRTSLPPEHEQLAGPVAERAGHETDTIPSSDHERNPTIVARLRGKSVARRSSEQKKPMSEVSTAMQGRAGVCSDASAGLPRKLARGSCGTAPVFAD